MTAAELVAEARRLTATTEAAFASDDPCRMDHAEMLCGDFARTALPRLVALVEAAVEMREAERDTGSPLVPYPYGPCAVHDYGCPATVTGKRSGACNCGGAVIDARIVASRLAFDALAGGEEKSRG